MTTAVYDRLARVAGADTQNTTPGGQITRVEKIEILDNGLLFLGSGHCYTISLCRAWAAARFDPRQMPDWSIFLDNQEDMAFGCIVVDTKQDKVWMIDEEMVPNVVQDRFVAVGSGAPYALGALSAGADVPQALEVAAQYDPNSSAPFSVRTF